MAGPNSTKKVLTTSSGIAMADDIENRWAAFSHRTYADAVLGLMRSIHFDAQGLSRTYWDFFSAFVLFFSVFLLFAAVLVWLLAGLPRIRSIAWA
jgi:hypothetical protein